MKVIKTRNLNKKLIPLQSAIQIRGEVVGIGLTTYEISFIEYTRTGVNRRLHAFDRLESDHFQLGDMIAVDCIVVEQLLDDDNQLIYKVHLRAIGSVISSLYIKPSSIVEILENHHAAA